MPFIFLSKTIWVNLAKVYSKIFIIFLTECIFLQKIKFTWSWIKTFQCVLKIVPKVYHGKKNLI